VPIPSGLVSRIARAQRQKAERRKGFDRGLQKGGDEGQRQTACACACTGDPSDSGRNLVPVVKPMRAEKLELGVRLLVSHTSRLIDLCNAAESRYTLTRAAGVSGDLW
jgi:hypothetical protein